MRKTVWAAGLFAAVVTTGSWCKPSEADTSSFRELVVSTSKTIKAQEHGPILDMKLVERGIFECVYASDQTTIRDRVFIRGSDSCGFLDGTEDFKSKKDRIAGYVNQFLPGVDQPGETFCYAVQFPADYKHRKIPLKDYIKQIDAVAPDKPEISHSQKWIETEKTIKNQLKGELHSGSTFHIKNHFKKPCDLILVTQKQPFAPKGAERKLGGLQLMAKEVGMVARVNADWIYIGINIAKLYRSGNYSSRLVTTHPRRNDTADTMLYGDNGFTFLNIISYTAFGVGFVYFVPAETIVAEVGTLYTLTIGSIVWLSKNWRVLLR